MSQLTIVAIFTIKPAFETEFRTEFKKIVEASRREAGCIAYHLNQDTKQPDVYAFTEIWASQQAIDEHNKTAHFKHFKAFMADKVIDGRVHVMKTLF